MVTSPLSRMNAVSPVQPEPIPTCASTRDWPRPFPRITPSTRAGCSREAVRAAFMVSAASASSTTNTSVITMPMAGLPARRRALTNSEAIALEVVSVSSIMPGSPRGVGTAGWGHGRLQTRPSRASIRSAEAGPQVPAS